VRRGEAAERAASRSTSPGGIALPGLLPAFVLAAVTRGRLLLQALPGFPVAARVDSLPGVAGVALARLTERLAHTLPVQLSCLVVVDHVLDSSLAAGSARMSMEGPTEGVEHGTLWREHQARRDLRQAGRVGHSPRRGIRATQLRLPRVSRIV
jgi:hypothetical protein